MFSIVEGNLFSKNNNLATINIKGTGMFIDFTFPILSDIGAVNEESTIYLHFVMKDLNGTITSYYYGFATKLELDFFKEVISIKGLGEKTAIALLSMYDAPSLVEIINNDDLKSLTKVPKIGGKTAEKLMVDMKKLTKLSYVNSVGSSNLNITASDVIEKAVSGISGLGFKGFEKVLNKIATETVFTDSGSLVKAVLQALKK